MAVAFKGILLFSEASRIFYYESIFYTARQIQDAVFSIPPLAGFYYLIPAIVFLQLFYLPRINRLKCKSSWRLFLVRTVNTWCLLGFLFFLLWGYNYNISGIAKFSEQQILKPEKEDVVAAYKNILKRAEYTRSTIKFNLDSTHITDIGILADDSSIQAHVKAVLNGFGYHTDHNLPVRHLKPKGVLRRLGIAGIYNPFTGEANIDSGLDPLSQVFTTAHEIAHGYGVASEAEANFVAYLSCKSIGTPAVVYAADYILWRYIASEIREVCSPGEIQELAELIPEEISRDREDIRRLSMQYQDYLPGMSNAVNDAYLKAQGVKSGIENYNEFVELVFSLEPELIQNQ